MYKRAIPYFLSVGAVFLLSIFLLDRIFLSPGLTGDGPFYVELHTTEDAPLYLRLDTAMTSPLYLNLDMDTATSSPLYVQPPETISVKVFNADYLEPFAIYATFDTAQRNTRLAARSRREGRVQYVNDVNVARLDAPFYGNLTTCPKIPLRRGGCGYLILAYPTDSPPPRSFTIYCPLTASAETCKTSATLQTYSRLFRDRGELDFMPGFSWAVSVTHYRFDNLGTVLEPTGFYFEW